jgi:carbon monoxide dehydrogenase subunit G
VKIESAFEVPASPERAWELLMDVPRVIPCMPGTELTEAVDDANWKAKMTVKLGPMSFAFATDVKREDADEAARRARLSARARETRGRGGGQATIESTLVPLGSGTRVEIVTDLTLSGALAQYGRGMVADVSNRLVGQFAECLRNELTAEPAGAATGAAAEEEPASPAQAAAPKPISALSLAAGLVRGRLRALIERLRGRG